MERPIVLLARLNDISLDVEMLSARLAEIEAGLAEPAALAPARRAAARRDAVMAGARARQQESEQDQGAVAERLARAEKRLYSGEVSSPRELEDAEHDVRQLRRQLAAAEERVLEAMIAVEEAAARQAESQERLALLIREWQDGAVALRSEQAELMARLADERERESTARRVVPPDLLVVFDALRARRGGRAVAHLEGDACAACRVTVPPGLLAVARDGEELVYCDNCGRLLWGE